MLIFKGVACFVVGSATLKSKEPGGSSAFKSPFDRDNRDVVRASPCVFVNGEAEN